MPLTHAKPSAIQWRRGLGAVIAGAVLLAASAAMAQRADAQRIDNNVAVFAALDKVTARISRLEIKLGDTVKFGALEITPRLCYSRPPDLQPKTTTFVVVTERQLDGSKKRIFSGWMFAEEPGLNAVEHPVYDVWLTGCMSPKPTPGGRPAAQVSGGPPARGPAADAGAGTPDTGEPAPRRRPPR